MLLNALTFCAILSIIAITSVVIVLCVLIIADLLKDFNK